MLLQNQFKVRCCAIEPGNEWFATGAADRVIKIWDLASGKLKVSLTGHVSVVRGLAVSSRQPYLFSCGEDRQVLSEHLTHPGLGLILSCRLSVGTLSTTK